MRFLMTVSIPFLVFFVACDRTDQASKKQEKWDAHYVKANLLEMYDILLDSPLNKQEIKKLNWEGLVFSDINGAVVDVRAYKGDFFLVCHFKDKFYFFDDRGTIQQLSLIHI